MCVCMCVCVCVRMRVRPHGSMVRFAARAGGGDPSHALWFTPVRGFGAGSKTLWVRRYRHFDHRGLPRMCVCALCAHLAVPYTQPSVLPQRGVRPSWVFLRPGPEGRHGSSLARCLTYFRGCVLAPRRCLYSLRSIFDYFDVLWKKTYFLGIFYPI